MNVAASTRRKALLCIFRLFRKRRGGCMSAHDIEKCWVRTGLRREDLHKALRESAQANLINLRRGGGGIGYELSYLGERAMESAMSHPVDAVRDWVTLGRARIRRGDGRRAGPAAGERRKPEAGEVAAPPLPKVS